MRRLSIRWCASWSAAAIALALGLAAAWPARAQDDVDDVLGGFEDETEEDYFEDLPETAPEERWWDLLGSVSLAASYNYLDHHFTAPLVGVDTDWGGLSRLRVKGFLQLDLDLPWEWRARGSGYGFYDFAYRIGGRGMYTDDVLEEYEWDTELQEAWVEGRVTKQLDLALGRQVVNWGRSDTLRVTDVLNPLDLREPGLTDISDVRRSLTMAKADYYVGDWSLSALFVPETRFDLLPPFGSDFFPVFGSATIPLPDDRPSRWNGHLQFGGALTGVFQGWDLSFYGARYWANQAHVELDLGGAAPAVRRYDRHTMFGAGGNVTLGSWLFKGELAYIRGFSFTTLAAGAVDRFDKDRFDAMLGVEYYGIDDLNVALELVNRHVLSFDERVANAPTPQKENAFEAALRISADLMNERLSLTALGVIFDVDASDGSFVRLEGSYDLIDALELGVGIVFFQEGDSLFFGSIEDNDRVFAELTYSF